MGRSNLTPSDIKAKKIVSANLNNLLIKNNKKKIDVQRETKIPRSTISDYFNGKTSPSKESLLKLANVFNVSPADIDPRYSNNKPTNKYSDADLDEMIDNAHSYDGKPVDDHDRALIRQYLKALFSNK